MIGARRMISSQDICIKAGNRFDVVVRKCSSELRTSKAEVILGFDRTHIPSEISRSQ